jgi:DNA-binding MarR family transcriptional regulator
MNVQEEDQPVYVQLRQLMFQSKHRIYQIAEKYDLTLMQSTALTMLTEDNPKAMRALSDYFMCDASTVTGLVDRLEGRHLIARSNHPTDRRVKLLALTDEGSKLREQIMAETEKAETKRLNEILTKTEVATLQTILSKILNETDPSNNS